MRKLIITALCVAVFSAFSVVVSYTAQDTVIESPNVKIIIDGKTSTYSSAPIIVNGRTLLPFREVLNKLGVPNDDRYILWNGTERSVTINKDSTRIYLKIGIKAAHVNNRPVTIDVAPIIHKGRTYIPARFIAQSLGMKVSWDPVSTTVLLRNEEDYNNVKDILNKVNSAMNSLERLKVVEAGSTSINLYGVGISADTKIESKFDFKNKFMHYIIGSSFKYDQNEETQKAEAYTDGSMIYVNADGEWEGSGLDLGQSRKMFTFDDLISDDILCSGLYVDSTFSDTIILKGKIDLKNYSSEYFELQEIEGYLFRDVSVEISIDKDTYYVNKIGMRITAISKSTENAEINTSLDTIYSDFNGNLEFNPPQGLALRVPTTTPIATSTPIPATTQGVTQTSTITPRVTPTHSASSSVSPTSTPRSVTGNLTVKMHNSNTQNQSNSISPVFQLVNEGDSTVNLQDVKIRYYFTVNGNRTQNFWCDWSTIENTNVNGQFVKSPSSGSKYDCYLEVGFNASAGNLESGKTIEVKCRFAKDDWSNYTQTDDYSFNQTSNDFTVWDKVPAYISNKLVWGTEP